MILIVAERANLASTYRRWYTADEWYGMTLKLGAFRNGHSGHQLLKSIGVLSYDESVNLNPPGRERDGIPFDYNLADQVAAIIRDDPAWTRIVLCGRRASRCFGIDWPARYGSLIQGRYVPAPHPSGRNRWWNRDPCTDLERILTREMMIRSLINDTEVMGHCRVCQQPLICVDDADLCPAHDSV